MARIRSRVTGEERDTDNMTETQRQHLLSSGRWERLDDDPEPEPSGDEPPPRTGAGSGRDAWAAYAERVHGLTVPDDMGRDAIIDELESRGVRLFGERPDAD